MLKRDKTDDENSDGDVELKGDQTYDALAYETMPHPRKVTAWDTRTLVMAYRANMSPKMDSCEKEILAVAAEASNENALLQFQSTVSAMVRGDPVFYHWCFYQIMTNLDLNLEKGGALMGEKAEIFFKSMRGLWLLAMTLDQERGSKKYFNYLQERYLQISKDYFGRDLDPIYKPLSEETLENSGITTKIFKNKKAAPASID